MNAGPAIRSSSLTTTRLPLAILAALLIGGIWSVVSLGVNPAAILGSLGNAVDFIGRMFPLDFPPLRETAALVGETLAIVLLATVLSVVLSVPLSLAAAAPTRSSTTGQAAARFLTVLARSLPDLVLAIIFLRMFGVGPAAGVLAMGLHSVGMVAKVYSDAIEELDDGPRQAVAAVGGTRRQQIFAAVLPQLAPQLIATALHRFDINLRTSVLLGYVGVGGVGLAISDSLRVFNYQRGMALALLVLLLCIVVELLSGALRAAIMRRSGGAPLTKASLRRLTPPWTLGRTGRFGGMAVLAAVTAVAVWAVDLNWERIGRGVADIPQTAALFFPPATGGVLELILEELLVTVQIGFAATLLGGVVAVPVGVLAARNVVANPYIHGVFRGLTVVVRGIPELILAIIFVVISGLGAVAGTLALAVGVVGLLAKLVADSIEETDTDVQEAVRAVGATGPQVFFAATLRQAAPALVGHTLYVLDHNIRAATLLGVVGAGGVGFLLLNAARVNHFDVVTTIVLLLLAVVLAVEAVSVWLRRTIR